MAAPDLEKEIIEAEAKAWHALGRYKFAMFGYWAAIWVHLNRIAGQRKPNPFKNLVVAARMNWPGHYAAGVILPMAANNAWTDWANRMADSPATMDSQEISRLAFMAGWDACEEDGRQ